MSQFREKVTYFNQKKREMLEVDKEIKIKLIELQDKAEKEIGVIREKFDAEKISLMAPLDKLRETYKAEVKAWCGITDGEAMNVVQMLEAVKRIQDME